MLTVHAPAKVNLVLEVLERREDYHIISSIAQTVDLCDALSFEPADDLHFTCSAPELVQDNLVTRAASLLRERFGIRAGARMHLEKRIPWGAGLGGGSSDAAATLLALNRLWAIDAPADRLETLAAELGSDVPLFLRGGTVLVEGKGEVVHPLTNHPSMHVVLLAPAAPVIRGKTGLMYRRLRPELFTRGQFVRAAAFALERGRRVPEDLMHNAFENVADEVFPGLAHDRALLEDAVGVRVHLAGSGPCLYALLPSRAAAAAAATRLAGREHRVFVVQTMAPAAPQSVRDA
ncbi:MAG: 4-(cytidine 5'-diphospho)-2-C-methyl-D-erythritol kinase [Dehalococcoidia bacterium]|nr:4-(cytidine 5'-diphospho)-2-C-methyl-D-erythritol kinase [Dehalococcoidia bacterium]